MADLSAYDQVFEDAGREWNVDPKLLKAMAGQESGGNPSIVSKAGAQGLMQIMPQTAKTLGVTDVNDPVQSIFGAAKYMSQALDAEGSPERALLYYHGGPRWRQAYGDESAKYVPAVTARYRALAGGQDTSQPTPSQPAGAAPGGSQGGGPLIVGDSLASQGGLGGSGVVGASPKEVLDSVMALSADRVKGRDVVLSSGASNNPGQAALVYTQVNALKAKGANSVTVVGVGDRPDFSGVNDTLAKLTTNAGGKFVPLPPGSLSSDHVHPTRQGYNALLAAAAPRPTVGTY